MIKAKASESRIKAMIAEQRPNWVYLGKSIDPESEFFYICGPEGPENRSGYQTEQQALKQIEIKIAVHVLETIGIEDWHDYDWHLWCDSAERMVTEIVRRDKEYRQAAEDLAPMRGLVKAMMGR